MLAQLSGFSKIRQRRSRSLRNVAFEPKLLYSRVVIFAKNHLESNIYSL